MRTHFCTECGREINTDEDSSLLCESCWDKHEELKQKILDIIYWADWKTKTRDDGHEERRIENEDIIVQAIIETVRGCDKA